MGLKDQRLAIMWVKANIQLFCGDPNRILLAGASAGGALVHLHLLQKSSENYFVAMISHSGVTYCPWVLETRPRELSKNFLDHIGCQIDSKDLKHCLQSKTVDEIKQASEYLQPYKSNPITVFKPVVEPVDIEDAFLTKHPEEIIKNGEAANITWLVSYTEREGSCNAAQFLKYNENGIPEIEILNSRWTELAPIMLYFNKSLEKEEWDHYSIYLKEKYLGDKKFTEENYRPLEDMFGSILFNNGVKEAIEMHRKYCPGKVYAYYYNYPHNFGLGNVFSSREELHFGADHLSDTTLTIPMKGFKQFPLTEKDKSLREKLINMYHSLANSEVVTFGDLEIPHDSGILYINENCYGIDDCSGENTDDGCKCYKYV